jgi:uncharacterized RDD family membrane protein YckC
MTYAYGSPDVRVTGRRIVATIIDGILFGIVSNVFGSVFGLRKASSGFDLTRLSIKGSLWLTVTVVLYYVLLEGLFGRTLGKLITGIRVVDAETGGRPGLLSAFVRTLLRLIDGIFAYLVGFIVVVNSERRRRLGDMAARTLVVRAR